MPFTPSAHAGIVHRFTPKLTAFEHGKDNQADNPHTLLWIGGLNDGLLTVSYATALAHTLPPNWSLVQVLLSSANKGWGTSSLKQDARELAQCVKYFQERRPGAKIVLMGHSTGCQDCMEYLVGEGHAERPAVQAVILQSPVSDREALAEEFPPDKLNSSIKLAQEWVKSNRGNDVLPNSATAPLTPVTANRWLSLCSPDKNGDDDYFSSDLEAHQLQATFGRIKEKAQVLFLYGGDDEYVPDYVDRKGLVAKWTSIVRENGGTVDDENGGIVPDAHHNLEGDDDAVVQDLCKRVNGFLKNFGGD
ncbi:uncharacterized protein K452DRAFT_288778 [Aplosporella prunicola CBS 121167]|uniref:DUF1749-domain-containing protein n=1 Tax=Aplosporella prunicola CBS 121167 TaxID=1176127 RepID=A0A6A6BBS9_9PEZI|nr:uncharacterized protein K452DRAFT_288778 [Aplosporella prunicola CBS 121167]KAF2140685.1 hypothetical protein K452DRAFT_288778 [Aplosporella prunicola CBS 121167]